MPDVVSSTVSESQQVLGTAVREIAGSLARADALAAEALLSGLLGKCGGAATLIDYAVVAKQSDAMTLLHLVRTLAEDKAERTRAAEHLVGLRGRPPAWAKALDAVTIGECWQYQEALGDNVSVLCSFERDGAQHGIVAQLVFDQRVAGWAKALYLIDDPAGVLAGVREQVASSDGALRLTALPPARARAAIEDGLAATATRPGLAPEDSVARYRLLALARCRALPGPRRAPAMTERRRDALVTEFLDDNGIKRTSAILRCARMIVDYGCDTDDGDPLRLSPVRMVGMAARLRRDLDTGQRKVLPVVLNAYLPWAGAKRGVPPRLLGEAIAHARRIAPDHAMIPD
jgi:hypothetical protein